MPHTGRKRDQSHQRSEIRTQSERPLPDRLCPGHVNPLCILPGRGRRIFCQQDREGTQPVRFHQRLTDPCLISPLTDHDHQRAVGFPDPDIRPGQKSGKLHHPHRFHPETVTVLLNDRRHRQRRGIGSAAAGQDHLSGIKDFRHGHQPFQLRPKTYQQLLFAERRQPEYLFSDRIVIFHPVHT